MLDVNLARALELFAQPKGKGRRSAPVRVIGDHPETKAPVEIMDGPYGLYVKHGKINATVPKEKKPEDLTMAEALVLLAEKEGSTPAKAPKKAAKGKAKGGKAKGAKKAAKKGKKAPLPEENDKPVGSRTEAKLAARARAAAKSAEKNG